MLRTGQHTAQPAIQTATCTTACCTVSHHMLHLQTAAGLQFIDLTGTIRTLVAHSGVAYGMVNVQTRHTTTAVLVNEHEPLLLEDMRRVLARVVPQADAYLHNDFTIRTHNLTPEERPNGHAHCRALFLTSAVTVNILHGELQLGQWQRIFFVELDHARPRTVSVMVIGQATPRDDEWE
jgi:secondary thiamine-phosphate synthase enzyme